MLCYINFSCHLMYDDLFKVTVAFLCLVGTELNKAKEERKKQTWEIKFNLLYHNISKFNEPSALLKISVNTNTVREAGDVIKGAGDSFSLWELVVSYLFIFWGWNVLSEEQTNKPANWMHFQFMCCYFTASSTFGDGLFLLLCWWCDQSRIQ